jgi:hypothetical protein
MLVTSNVGPTEASLAASYRAARKRLNSTVRHAPAPLPVPVKPAYRLAKGAILQKLKMAPPTWKVIMREVCKARNVSYEDLVGPQRWRHLIGPRHECMYRLYTEANFSYERIGVIFGRDHTTAMHAVRAHRKRLINPQHSQVSAKK